MDDAIVKLETFEPLKQNPPPPLNSSLGALTVIDLSSSDSDSETDSPNKKRARDSNGAINGGEGSYKKQKAEFVLPIGFLEPLQEIELLHVQQRSPRVAQRCKQFWKAGDYDGGVCVDPSLASSSGGMDHIRVHPKFLHSNATSHKWALGAFAELLDNSLDEVCYGATFVNIDMLENKDRSKMLLIEDNGGGMDPDKMRQCMSLGYSEKCKLANTIGQFIYVYCSLLSLPLPLSLALPDGNGFKTSTMRLGADVIVFSRCLGKNGKSYPSLLDSILNVVLSYLLLSLTQSIGMLSYTFLRSTGKEDIVVPMLDFEKKGRDWNKLMRSSTCDWTNNVEAIVQWSPYSSESDLLKQFNLMNEHGTRIIIYNLWEDDEGEMELDFGTERHDIQIRGANRDEQKIEMAKRFPNSRHFLTYRHSLRSYASILYLRLPHGYRIVLRGKDVEHHNIVNDMMLPQEVTYRPTSGVGDGISRDQNMVAVVRIGFVKDAKDHIDVQGFNVYHKNRLIKPFWRVWNAAGSDGRGVIGVLEADFVEPAHDKQGFERTIVLSRLEARLIQMQKNYWSTLCHKIGYAPRRNKKLLKESEAREGSLGYSSPQSFKHGNTHCGNKSSSSETASPLAAESSDYEAQTITPNNSSYSYKASSYQKHGHVEIEQDRASSGRTEKIITRSHLKADDKCNGNGHAPKSDISARNQIILENSLLKDRLKKMEESFLRDLELERQRRITLEALVNGDTPISDISAVDQLKAENLELKSSLKKMEESFPSDRVESLEAQLKESELKIEEMGKEHEALLDLFAEERNHRDNEEELLRKKLKDASNTIQELLNKVTMLEKMKSINCKPELTRGT
ncbi:hypothetical protein GIB67_041811 [Kingdonia uniflora]|uniref:Morc S5 domain-containing protein n=1 Tax=Kingdonia uniflora TaxID=39325 RepID=A0A7J7L5U6_9MAGN|nr:hypothetical protein GIB67_041811 [Kingdonia uniflora]